MPHPRRVIVVAREEGSLLIVLEVSTKSGRVRWSGPVQGLGFGLSAFSIALFLHIMLPEVKGGLRIVVVRIYWITLLGVRYVERLIVGELLEATITPLLRASYGPDLAMPRPTCFVRYLPSIYLT